MQKYNPIQHNRTIWYDPTRTKNHPRNCKDHHKFCTLDYEWNDNTATLEHMNRPINSTIPNVTLPANTERTQVKYENFTEETIDDWIAQSMNRTIGSMLNPNKKFFIPTMLDDDLKVRYRKEKKHLKVEADDTYFKSRKIVSSEKSYLSHKKNKTIDISELIVDYKKLEPRPSLGKTPITHRQQRNHPPKQQIKRRNALMLEKDIHYERFMKEKKTSDPDSRFNIESERKVIESLNKNKLFTLNYESLKRQRINDNAPCSITEYDGMQIALPVDKFSLEKSSKHEQRKQEEQQQVYRLKGNMQAQKAYSIMQNFSTTQTRRSFKTKVSFSEDKQKSRQNFRGNHTNSKLFSLKSLHDPATFFAINKTQKKPSSHSHKEQHPKSGLGKKVIKLLEEMHVESENINIEMAKFELHPEFVQLTRLDPQSIAHKWIRKAQEQLTLHHFQTAFECYKQSMIADPQLFNPIYNFAALLQRENRYSCSLQWFKLAKEFQTDTERVTFAISIINMKMEKFEESFQEISSLIGYLTEKKKKVDIRYYYLRAICNKKFGKYDAAKRDYRLVLEHSRPHNYEELNQFIFSYIFAKKRRYVAHPSCLAYTKMHELVYFTLYEKGSTLISEGDLTLNLSSKIKDFKFFRRFPPQLVQRLVKLSVYEYHQKGEVVFVKPDQCIIILDGMLTIKNHQTSIVTHSITAILQQGDFLGANSIDTHLNHNLNNWYCTHTEVQLLRMKSQQFESFWKGQFTIDIDEKYNWLKNNVLLGGLCDRVLFKLCEVMGGRRVGRGQVVFNDGSYRVKRANKNGRGFGLVYGGLGVAGESVGSRQVEHDTRDHKALENTEASNTASSKSSSNEIKHPGLFIVKSGKIEIQDDRGFSNSNIISSGDFFGENLIIDTDGFHNYGRMVVASDQAEFYVLQLKDLIWCFSLEDQEIMLKNCQNMERRKSLELIKDLRKRYHEYLDIKEGINLTS